MRLPWRREASIVPSKRVGTKQQELEAAKQILSEVFHVRPADVDEMLLRRLEERNRNQECQNGLWPATFSLGE
jgi:hypothetical protein